LRFPSRSIRDVSTCSVHRNFKASRSARCVSLPTQSVGTLTCLTQTAFCLHTLVGFILVIFYLFVFPHKRIELIYYFCYYY
jgi:hypothetical protein